MNEENKRALLSILCHGSIFFSSSIVSMAIPLAILYTSKDRVVRANAKEAFNCHITIYIWVIIGLILIPIGLIIRFLFDLTILGIPIGYILVYFGFFIAILGGFLSMILPFIAIICVMIKPSIPYYYPEIFRFIK